MEYNASKEGMTTVTAYITAISKDGKFGGIGAVLESGQHKHEISQNFSMEVTQNQIEIVSIIRCLEKLNRPCRTVLYIDSKHLVRMINDKWPFRWKNENWLKQDGEEVANRHLWEKLIPLLEKHKVFMRWSSGVNNESIRLANNLCFKALEKAGRFA